MKEFSGEQLENLLKDILELLVKHGIRNPETFLRNSEIKKEFRQLQKEGKKVHEAYDILQDKN